MEGRPFGQYRLVEILGRGGMGEVWRAYDTATDRVVALKVLPSNLAGDETFQRRFRREARVAAGLTDPHVVPIHGYGEIDGSLYVDMRLIAGQDLAGLLASGPLAPPRAVTIVEQIAAALQAAHDEGLVHRDIKPSNILVTKSDFAYLIDFGIARLTGEVGLTGVGSTIGTWAYMAPERFSSGEPDPRSDVYALACVLHQSLTGRQPYPGNRVEQQVAGHLSTPPPAPSFVNRSVPASFDPVIAKGLSKNPDTRYQTATDFAKAARAALASPPQRPAPPAPIPVPPHQFATVPRSWPPVASSPPRALPPSGPLPRAPLPQPKSNRKLVYGIAAAVVAVVAIVATGVVIGTQSGSGPEPVVTDTADPPRPSGPSFEGSFTASYTSATDFDGVPLDGDPLDDLKFVVESYCKGTVCTASATTVDRPDGVQSFTFDYLDGRWVSVSVESGSTCGDQTSERWRIYSLDPDPDGSLAGEFRSIWPTGGCNNVWQVAFDRTGDADSGVQVTDPESLPALATSPAEAFRGRYHSVQQYPNGGAKFENDYVVNTYCLRAGDRCLSFAHNEQGNEALLFTADQWVAQAFALPGECTDGRPQVSDFKTTYPLPKSADDPIAVLTGRGTQTVTGSCSGTNDFDQTFTRIGN